MPLHPWDIEVEGKHSRNEVDLQYFPRRILASRQLGLFRILQLSLARRTSLKNCMSLKPSPPSLLLIRLIGSLKQDIVYVGIVANTDLSMVIRPAVDRNLEYQLMAHCFIMSTIKLKRSFFLRPKCSSSPRRTWCHPQTANG